MAGELRTSQFRFTTTADDDFVIGNPGAVGTTTKFLVFQTNTAPGIATNPHIRCEHSGGSPGTWSFIVSKTGSSDPSGEVNLSNLAYTNSNNTFTGVNIFNTGAFTVNSVVSLSGNATIGTTFANTLTINSATTVANAISLNGATTIGQAAITLNRAGAIASAASSGLSVWEGTGETGYWKVSSDRVGWSLKAPSNANFVKLIPGAASVSLTFPAVNGTLALVSDIDAAIGAGSFSANKAIISGGGGALAVSATTAADILTLSGFDSAFSGTTVASKISAISSTSSEVVAARQGQVDLVSNIATLLSQTATAAQVISSDVTISKNFKLATASGATGFLVLQDTFTPANWYKISIVAGVLTITLVE